MLDWQILSLQHVTATAVNVEQQPSAMVSNIHGVFNE
jgi:hypothetical protein